jgi:hypothetical protein
MAVAFRCRAKVGAISRPDEIRSAVSTQFITRPGPARMAMKPSQRLEQCHGGAIAAARISAASWLLDLRCEVENVVQCRISGLTCRSPRTEWLTGGRPAAVVTPMIVPAPGARFRRRGSIHREVRNASQLPVGH